MVNNQGNEPEKISFERQSFTVDGSVSVELSSDRMEAYLRVVTAMGGGRPLTREDIDKALAESGVVFGIIEQVKDYALNLQNPAQFTVARGIEPIHGVDAAIEIKCDFSHLIGKPKELIDGRADFYNLNLIHNVEPGEVLAVKTPPTQGSPGKDVLGQEIPSRPGKDCKLVAGVNVELSEDKLVASATAPGHAVVLGNKIAVSKVYEVLGDVDLKTGNIDFHGSVCVKGSIREGFKVTAENDVEVNGTISDGTVECTGNLTVKNGIIGRRSQIKAGGNIVTKFIENASVECGSNLMVGEAILHSKVFAGKSIVVAGKGTIAGGLIRAGEDIECKTLGSPMATATELEVGISPELRQKFASVTKEKQRKAEEFDKAAKAVKLLKMLEQQLGGTLPSDKRAILDRVVKVEAELAAVMEEVTWSLRDIEAQMHQAESGRIKVHGTLNPGVKVSIGIAIKHFYDKVNFAVLTKAGADIKITPYK